jgi:signal recognition particle GTPase
MADLQAALEVQIAKALRAVDVANTIAAALASQRPRDKVSERRLEAAVRRVQTIRAALLEAGVKLPPLRKISQFDRKYGMGGDKEASLP